MKKIILSIAFLFFSLSASEAFACSCMASDKPFKTQVKDAYKTSNAIFTGEVLEIKKTDQYSLTVKLKVNKSWKGIESKEITISTGENSAICGYSFEVGKTYIIYAYGKDEKLSTGICSRTAIADKNKDVAVLNKLKKPKSFPK